MDKMKNVVHKLLESRGSKEKLPTLPDHVKDYVSLGKCDADNMKPKSSKSLG